MSFLTVAFDCARAAERSGSSVWESLAVWADGDQPGASPETLKATIKAAGASYAETVGDPDWSPNKVSTFRVYSKLIRDARGYGIAVTTGDADGTLAARGVDAVRQEVKAAKAEAGAGEAPEAEAGGAEGGSVAAEFDKLEPLEQVKLCVALIEKASDKLNNDDKEQVREMLAKLAAVI